MSHDPVSHEDLYRELGEISTKVDMILAAQQTLEPRVSSLERFRAGCSAVLGFLTFIASAVGSGHLPLEK